MAKITLCGSINFKKEFNKWNKELSLCGHIVYSVSCFTHLDNDISNKEKIKLARVHMKKIEYSDEIFVLDVNGYIPESTRRDIEYAKKLNKRVKYLSEEIEK